MAQSNVTWPKPYILKIYERAISEGCIRIELEGNEERFKSLKAAFYRLRRRSDDQYSDYIQPSHHLCTITWEEDRGTALVTYDKLPDGMNLPDITSIENKMDMPSHTATLSPGLPPLQQATDLEEPAVPFDSDAMVRGLLAKVGAEIEKDAGLDSEIE